jgi:cytidylate kinase
MWLMDESNKTPDPHTGEMLDAAKRRMQRWLVSPELREHMRSAEDVTRPTETGAYISLSREAGAGGLTIARIIGQRLGWDVLDKELVEFIAERYDVPRDTLDLVDETGANWFYDVLGSFLNARVVSHDSFVVHLERIICLAAMHGNVVFVGRGAQFVLPRHCGVAARIIKPKKLRIETMMQRRHISRQEAAALVDDLDRQRREFCQRHFQHDIEESAEYELIINTGRVSEQAAAELIIDAFCRVQRVSSSDEPSGQTD